MTAERWLTVAEAAERIGMKPLSVYRRIWAGEIKAADMRMRGSDKASYRVAESALQKYLTERVLEHPPAVARWVRRRDRGGTAPTGGAHRS